MCLICFYGMDVCNIFGDVVLLEDFGKFFGYDFYEVEVRWFVSWEWVYMVEDILWWWIKFGLCLILEEIVEFDVYFNVYFVELIGVVV